jgi:hypothetical protein
MSLFCVHILMAAVAEYSSGLMGSFNFFFFSFWCFKYVILVSSGLHYFWWNSTFVLIIVFLYVKRKSSLTALKIFFLSLIFSSLTVMCLCLVSLYLVKCGVGVGRGAESEQASWGLNQPRVPCTLPLSYTLACFFVSNCLIEIFKFICMAFYFVYMTLILK